MQKKLDINNGTYYIFYYDITLKHSLNYSQVDAKLREYPPIQEPGNLETSRLGLSFRYFNRYIIET